MNHGWTSIWMNSICHMKVVSIITLTKSHIKTYHPYAILIKVCTHSNNARIQGSPKMKRMHYFYNPPTWCVKPMFPKNTLHFQELKKIFRAFIINHGVSISKKVIYNNKLHIFCLCSNGTSTCNLFGIKGQSSMVYNCSSMHALNFCWNKICHHQH
jgi:hypothetical protein